MMCADIESAGIDITDDVIRSGGKNISSFDITSFVFVTSVVKFSLSVVVISQNVTLHIFDILEW